MEAMLGFSQIAISFKLVGILIRKIIALEKDGFQYSDIAELIAELGSDAEFAKCVAELFQSVKK